MTASEVPIWPEFLKPVLEVLLDGQARSRREIRRMAADHAALSSSAQQERLDSGSTRVDSRLNWAITHLGKAGCLESPSRAMWRITDAGRTWLTQFPTGMHDFASANKYFSPYWPQPRIDDEIVVTDSEIVGESDPREQIDNAVDRLNATVIAELLERLRSSDPAFFEDVVVKLLLAMGYGGAEGRGTRIGGTSDGGVDGVIDQDALGLDRVYVQAKRYAEGNNVSAETIRGFIGALALKGVSRGVFITTSKFTSDALRHAKSPAAHVALIDGDRLASLMIRYKVGVQVKQTIELVEIDEDFFE